MSTPFSAAEAQAARDYAAAAKSGSNNSTSAPTSTLRDDARSLARALSTAATAIAGDVALVAEGIEAVSGIEEEKREQQQREEAITEEAEVQEPRKKRPQEEANPKGKTKTPSTATRDKLSFLVGVLVFGMSAFYLGAFPVSFVRCFIFLAAVLLGTRYFVYKSTKQHLFLLDLCYIVNGLWVLHLIFLPRSLFLRRCLFALSSGPLMGSIGAFRNSLVFHDLDKMTSLFIHLWPAALAWQSRWHQAPAVAPTLAASAAERKLASALSWSSAVGGGGSSFGLDAAAEGGSTTASPTAPSTSISCLGAFCLVPASSPAAVAAKAVAAAAAASPPLPAGWNEATFAQLLLGAYAFYFAWAIPYALYMFVFAKERIRERQYETLYTYQTRNPSSPMSKAIRRFPARFSGLVYMGVHLLATTVALSTTYLWWRSYAAHSLALITAVGVSAWNGAGYLHYVLRRARKEAAAEAAAAAAAAQAVAGKDKAN